MCCSVELNPGSLTSILSLLGAPPILLAPAVLPHLLAAGTPAALR